MSPYQHLFSTSTVLNVWRNLRTNNRDNNDLLLTFQIPTEDLRATKVKHGKQNHAIDSAVEERDEAARSGKAVGGSKSIGFVVPWRSMQAQKRELREKEKELAEALVVLAGEVSFTDLSPNLLSSLSTNPLIQIRHLCAGLSRQLSKIELQMADNAPFARGKNLYTGGEIARRFLPAIQILFDQRPIPQRMIFELCLELKDLVYAGMAGCEKEVLEWEYSNFNTFEELDEMIVKAITPQPIEQPPRSTSTNGRRIRDGSERQALRPKTSSSSTPQTGNRRSFTEPFLTDSQETLYALESLETTSSAMTYLEIPVDDFLAKSCITIRRILDRRTLSSYAKEKKRRTGRCAEYARCMKWAGMSWRQGGGCRRGCKNEDEDPEALPSWHSSSKWYVREREGERQKTLAL